MAGCVATQDGGRNAKHIVREGGFKQVSVTGSLIPIRVPTSPTARPLPQGSPVSTMSAEEFDRVVRRGQTGR